MVVNVKVMLPQKTSDDRSKNIWWQATGICPNQVNQAQYVVTSLKCNTNLPRETKRREKNNRAICIYIIYQSQECMRSSNIPDSLSDMSDDNVKDFWPFIKDLNDNAVNASYLRDYSMLVNVTTSLSKNHLQRCFGSQRAVQYRTTVRNSF